MTSHAEYSKRWQIRGHYPNGNKLAFPVSAFDYFEAKKKAEKLAKNGTIDSIVLIEPKRKLV